MEWKKRSHPEAQPAVLQPLSTSGKQRTPRIDSLDFSESSHLMLGENEAIMTALLPCCEERIDLIYCDPPFLSGKAYAARIGKNEDSRKPHEWDLAKGYRDTWRDGAEYLDMLYRRLKLMYRLLSSRGTLYLHLDWHASAYARVILDEIFGPDRLLNEIVWLYHGPSPIKTAFKRKHDTILVYTKTPDYIFNADAVRVPYSPSTVKTFRSSSKAGFGKKPDLERGKVPEDWWYFPVVARLHNERTGYPTQKPEALLERIVKASSHDDSIVGDFFCGSGTTAAAAEKNGRRWIACDSSQLAVFTTYQRLLEQDASSITIWQDQPSALAVSILEPVLETDLRDGTVSLRIDVPETDEVYCQLVEVDWYYNGEVFQSAEARRHPQGTLPLLDERPTFQHVYEQPGTHTIAARIIDNLGRTALHSLDIKPD